jgi:hypothetical protein
MAALVLRQETSLTVLKQDTSFVVFLATKDKTVLPLLQQAAKQWHDKGPGSTIGQLPLRAVMFICLLKALEQKLQGCATEGQERDEVLKMKWAILEQGQLKWVYQKWDHEAKTLKIDDAMGTWGQSELLQAVGEMIALVEPLQMVHRFHCTRPLGKLGPTPAADVVAFLLDISNRTARAQKLHAHLVKMIGLAALQLVGAQVKREGFKRSALANKVAEMTQRYAASFLLMTVAIAT